MDTINEEILKLVHELNDIRTVNKVQSALMREATERHLKQAELIESLSKRLDALLLKSTHRDSHKGDGGCWP
jgi:hypothetical protein